MIGKEHLAVELVFYNDLASLKRGVPTYAPHVNQILAIDGRHTTDHKWNSLSDDGSREYLNSFDNVKLIDRPDYEVAKRKLAKEICPTNHLLIIDSDEYVEGDWEEFYKSYSRILEFDIGRIDLYALKLQRLDDPSMFNFHPVIFHKPNQFTYYRDKHNIPIKKVYEKVDGIFAPTYFHFFVTGITLMHDHKLRTPQRLAVRQDNLDWQFKHQK